MPRAWQCNRIEKDFNSAIAGLQLVELNSNVGLSDGSVRVAVRAAALNFFDLLQMVGKYQGKPRFPLVPTTEGAGIVVESKSEKIHVGDVVICIGGSTLTEELVCDESQVYVLQKANENVNGKNVNFVGLAGLYVGFMTAYCGFIDRGELKKSDVVLITGCAGGMGVVALQFALHFGCQVIAAVSNEKKAAFCRNLGAHHTVLYDDLKQFKQRVKELTGGNGVDICYEIVGGAVFQTCASLIAPLGKLLVIGFAGGEIGQIPANLPLIKGYDVRGVRAGASIMLREELRQRMMHALRLYLQHGPLLPTTTFRFEHAPQAFQTMADRQAVGKLVIAMNQHSKL